MASMTPATARDVKRVARAEKPDIYDFGEAIDPNAPHNRRSTRKVNSMTKYRKTALIEATQWFKDGDHPAVMMASDVSGSTAANPLPFLDTLEGGNIVQVGDWIATGVKGEHWCIKPDVFAATYEPATAALTAMQPAIDAAVLVERERCASIAESRQYGIGFNPGAKGWDAAAEHIAAAIRALKRKPAPTPASQPVSPRYKLLA